MRFMGWSARNQSGCDSAYRRTGETLRLNTPSHQAGKNTGVVGAKAHAAG